MEDDSKPDLNFNIGEQALQKGEVRDGMQLVAWDCIQECNPLECPIGTVCSYVTKSSLRGLCALQTEYLQAFTSTIFETYRYLDQADTFRIGMHLVPLYSQLCRQKIVEKGVKQLAYQDAKGVTRIHPIYKEMRETMKTITTIWRDMGFQAPNTPNLPGTEVNKLEGKKGYGDPNYYTEISKDADNKKGLIR